MKIDTGGKKYATVVIDPPWDVKHQTGLDKEKWGNNGYVNKVPYSTMPIEEIKAIKILDIMQDNAFLFCWTVNQFLVTTIEEIIPAWGMRYKFLMTWVKNGGPQFPNGPMHNTEWIAVACKGSPSFRDIRSFNTANVWPRGTHSAKPEQFYDLLRRVTPFPRIDIFNRRRIGGFDSWGDEAPRGEPPLPDTFQDVLDFTE